MKKLSVIFLVLLVFLTVTTLTSCKGDCTHEWGEWETVTAATCVAKGEQKRTCTKCTESETQTVPATGEHIFGEWETLVSPTLTTQGEKKRTCTCGATESDTIPVLIPTEGLIYTLINGGTAYEVSGIDTAVATTTDIVIAAVYQDKPVVRIGSYAFEGCTSLTSVTFGENSQLTTIGYFAFFGCTSLTSVTFGENSQLTTIGDYAFSGCTSLVSVTFGENSQLTTIGFSAFYYCTSLASVTFGENSQLTTIGDWEFRNCTSLASIVIPASVTSIGSSAFWDCSGLESITVAQGNTVYHSNGNCVIKTASKTLVVGCKNSVIPTDGSVTTIGSYAFSYCTSLTSIVIPESVTSIDRGAFYDCTSLASVTFETTTGWWRASSSTATSGPAISALYLANTAIAAKCLTDAYDNYYWKRS